MRGRWTITVAVGVLLVARASAQQSFPAVDRAVDSAARAGFAGMVVATRDGKVLYHRSTGFANPAARTAFELDTPLPIASITKSFTRAAILRLEQDGKLSTGDPISKFVPGLPAAQQVATVQQLLDMRGGFREYHERGGDSVPGDMERMTKAEALQRISEQALLFAPGTGRQYSNSGYTLLAAVVEAASGMPFEKYVQQALLEPAGMTATGFYGDGKWKAGSVSRATGRPVYRENAPERWPAVSWVLEGSGGMISTVRDLQRWIAALRHGQILDATELSKQYPQPDWAFYGGGNSVGYETLVFELDGGRETIILHTNSGLGRLPLAMQLAQAIHGGPLPAGIQSMIGSGGPVVTTTTSGPPPDGQREGVQRSGNPPPVAAPGVDPVRDAARAFVQALRAGGDDRLKAFAAEWLSETARTAVPPATLARWSQQARTANFLDLNPAGPHSAELKIVDSDGTTLITIEVAAAAPFRIEGISARKP